MQNELPQAELLSNSLSYLKQIRLCRMMNATNEGVLRDLCSERKLKLSISITGILAIFFKLNDMN